MIEITDCITNHYKAFSSAEQIEVVQDFFMETPFSHFPVLEEGVFIGNIASEEVEIIDASTSITDIKYTLAPFYVREKMTWFNVLEIFAKNNSNVVPILNEDNLYMGYYELEDILQFFYQTPYIKEQGTSIVLQKNSTDFSISQISQIVENNNAKLLGLFISEANPATIQATLKMGIGSVNELIQSFRRYEYEILSDHNEDNYWNNLKERSDYIDKYLNI
jgi:predicted transcriptional regulator